MFKFFFPRSGRALLLSAAAAVFFTSNVWAQYDSEDTAYVPFYVNVDATVSGFISCTDALGPDALGKTSGCPHWSADIVGGEDTVIHIPLVGPTGVRFVEAQRSAGIPNIVSGNGKVTVKLPVQSYKDAVVSLYTVDGKLVLRNNVSAANVANRVMRRSIAPGVYMLLVKGGGGVAGTYKLAHSGGRLDIDVSFRGENVVSGVNRQSKEVEKVRYWEVTVRAIMSGYVDTTIYQLRVVSGLNPKQNITLRSVSDGE